MRALIIEDESLIALSIMGALEDLGYTEAICVSDHSEAVRVFHTFEPDLVTADVKLAKGCGIDAALEIVASRPVPVVFLTGNPEKVRARVRQPVIVEKPFTVRMLEAGVREAVARPGVQAVAGLP